MRRAASRLLSTPLLAFLTLWALGAPPSPATAQATRMSTQVDNMFGMAGETPTARLLFAHDDHELCVVIAIVSGPSQLRAPLFRFKRREEGNPRSQPLKFKLPGKPERSVRHGDRIQVYEGCLPLAGDDDAVAPGTVIEFEYRDPRMLREPIEHDVAFPGPAATSGIDLLKDSAGNFWFKAVEPSADQEM